jgi:agmatine deiminase
MPATLSSTNPPEAWPSESTPGDCLASSPRNRPSPQQLGFCMPAEWEPHSATWAAWPRDDDYWGGALLPAQADFAGFLQELSRWEPVQLLVHDPAATEDAHRHLGEAIAAGRIQLHNIPQRDIWLRDTGPMFIRRGSELQAVSWEFNGWGDRFPADLDNQIADRIMTQLGFGPEALYHPGIVFEGGAIEVNGAGLGITTRQCLLAANRNPNLTEADLEAYLRDYLGIDQLIWLDQGLEGDHTDGHVDTITRFVGPRCCVTTICEDPADANHSPLQRNLETLQNWRDHQGHGLEVIGIPQPDLKLEFDGERLPLTYANFYIANGAILVPTFDCPQDDEALDILRSRFPQRQVIGLPALGLFNGGGGFHCATQQQPAIG